MLSSSVGAGGCERAVTDKQKERVGESLPSGDLFRRLYAVQLRIWQHPCFERWLRLPTTSLSYVTPRPRAPWFLFTTVAAGCPVPGALLHIGLPSSVRTVQMLPSPARQPQPSHSS